MATYSPIEIPMSVAADSESIPMTVGVEIGSGGGAIINNQNKTIHPSASDQSIQADSGYTGIGTATVKKVVVKNLSAANIVSGVTVKIGDEDDDDSIASVEGTASSGGITPTGTKEIGITQNGTTTTDVTNYADAEITVAVPASAVDTGTKQITSNGTGQDVVGYAEVDVAVPNSYSAGDEGKVVSNGALVAQTAHADVTPTTSDQTIDTTLNNSLKVKGDADLVAGNIKKDVEIFGVTGSYEGGGGITLAPMDYPVTFRNTRTGTIAIIRILYNATTMIAALTENITSNNSATYNNLLTDGTHFWIRNTGSAISYNGSPATYVKDGTYFMVTIPTGFDGTIPFIIT